MSESPDEGIWLVYGSWTGRGPYEVLNRLSSEEARIVSPAVVSEFGYRSDVNFSQRFETFWQFYAIAGRAAHDQACVLARTSWVEGGQRGEDFVVWGLVISPAAIAAGKADLRRLVASFPAPRKPERDEHLERVPLAAPNAENTAVAGDLPPEIVDAIERAGGGGSHSVGVAGGDMASRLALALALHEAIPSADRKVLSFATRRLESRNDLRLFFVARGEGEPPASPEVIERRAALRLWGWLAGTRGPLRSLGGDGILNRLQGMSGSDFLDKLLSDLGARAPDIADGCAIALAALEEAARMTEDAPRSLLVRVSLRCFEHSLPAAGQKALRHLEALWAIKRDVRLEIPDLLVPRLVLELGLLGQVSGELGADAIARVARTLLRPLGTHAASGAKLPPATVNRLVAEWHAAVDGKDASPADVAALRNACLAFAFRSEPRAQLDATRLAALLEHLCAGDPREVQAIVADPYGLHAVLSIFRDPGFAYLIAYRLKKRVSRAVWKASLGAVGLVRKDWVARLYAKGRDFADADLRVLLHVYAMTTA